MDLSSSSLSSSTSVKESSSVSSRKISSSSISSSSMSSKLSSAVSDISSEMDELLAAATGSSRGALTNMSDRVGGALRSVDLDLDDMLSGTSISGKSSSNISSSSNVSSSTKVTKMSSISQSSMEMVEGSGIDSTVKSSVKQSSTSASSASALVSEQKIVDGQLVKSDTIAEKASHASQSEKEKVVQDGHVLVDTGSKSETSSSGRLRATKEMSQAELDAFFQQDAAIAGKPVEALNFDKDKNLFEVTLVDLPEFSPKELTVKIVNGTITVYGTHEEQINEGTFKTHRYVRKFTVPQGLKTDNIEWNLNSNGALAITAGDTVKGGFSEVYLNCTIYKPRSFFKSLQQ